MWVADAEDEHRDAENCEGLAEVARPELLLTRCRRTNRRLEAFEPVGLRAEAQDFR